MKGSLQLFFIDPATAENNRELVRKISSYGEIAALVDIGYLASIASNDNFGIQHSLELEFFKGLIFVFVFSFITSIDCPIINGAKTEATGIRQYEIDDIPNPIIIATKDGIPPKNAFPALTVLQVIY